MNITINEDNLQINQIKEINQKVRAILINSKNEILVANYGGVYLLPGGKIDSTETPTNAIIRELKEETGYLYKENELQYIFTLNHYQKNYPKMKGIILNRLIKTHYYIGTITQISKQKQILTEKEKKGNFKLEFIQLEQIKDLINNNNNNPRNTYFKKELLKVLEIYKTYQK